ncbi:MAG: glycoside hydrolase family 172 protein [Phycisphaerales bacterium]
MRNSLPSGPTRLSIVASLVLFAAVTQLLAQDEWTPGIQDLYRLDRLPVLRECTKVASLSSYDRTGGNDDGFSGRYSFVRKEPGGLVLADLEGPGVIYRLHTPTPSDDTLEFYFDGEQTPRIQVKYRDLFTGRYPAFPRPLVGFGAGGFYSYVPLPYEKSCKVFLKAERTQFYQLNYATYPKGTPIQSFSAEPNAEQQRHLEKAVKLVSRTGKDISEYVVPAGGKVETLASKVTLEPGKAATLLDVDRPGRIVGIRLTPADALAGKGRDIVLRAFWDGEAEPAIAVPAGDFFGYAWGEPATKSLVVGTAGGVNYCYFPMPFDRSGRIELYAEPGSGRSVSVQAEVLFVPIARQKNEGKFYAVWRRENPTTKGKPFTFIETEGRGHLVGLIQQSQGLESGNTYFFEGDDQTTIDGELTIHGTGTEDFYNGGWYDVAGRWESRRSFPFSGCLDYKKHLGRTGAYRLFLGDAYAYRKSILQTIEHAPTGNDLINDYCGVTFLYSQDRPTCKISLPEADQRKVVDLKRIVFAAWWNIPIHAFSYRDAMLVKGAEKIGDQNVQFLSLQTKGGDAFGNHFVSFACEIPAAGVYKISVDTIKGPAQGQVQLSMDEAPVGPRVELYAETRERSPGIEMGTLELAEGTNHLLFKIVGKNEKSQGQAFDVINVICEKID